MYESKTYFDEVNKIWSGKLKMPLYNNSVSLGQVALEMLNRNPNKIGQISDDTGIQITNASVLFAGALIGAPIQANNPNLIISDIAHNMSLTKPNIIFCETEKFNDVRDALKKINFVAPIVTFDKRLEEAMFIDDFLKETGTEQDYVPEPIGNAEEEIAAILSSSGTTGLSKGVCLSHAQMTNTLPQAFNIYETDVLFLFTTLEWISAFGFLVCNALYSTTRIITREPFSPERFIDIIKKYNVTCSFLPPLCVNQLLNSPNISNADFTSLLKLFCGGSAVPVSIKNKIDKLLPNGSTIVGYGSTEASGVISVNTNSGKKGSVGLLQNCMNVKLVDDDNNLLKIGEKGEILAKGYFKFLGYYNDKKATNETRTADGWVCTGDVGYFDEDGYLYICDRKKDVFKYNTYHISPTEIEDVILECPGVAAVCVIGIPVKVNELIGALIVRATDSKVTEKEIYDFVASRVIDYKNLRGGIYFVNELPSTLTGKPLRRKACSIGFEFYKKHNKISETSM